MNTEQIRKLLKSYLDIIVRATEESTGIPGVPSGHLYAISMSEISLDAHEILIQKLVSKGLVNNQNHLLTATDKLLKLKAESESAS